MTTVHHCVGSLNSVGGVETYIKSLTEYHHTSLSHEIIDLHKGVDQSQFELLHIHTHYQLEALTSQCPAVFTAHNHTIYCPSGTKYLPTKSSCCDRQMSVSGCLWGHLIDGCGSRKPQNILKNFHNSYPTLHTLRDSKIPVIAVSDYVRNQAVRNGLSPENVFTVHNGISVPSVSAAPLDLSTHQNHRILFTGRIVPYKGLDWLLKSLVHVNPRIHLDIAGEGWDQERMEKLAKTLGLENRIHWHGWCNAEKLNALYQQCFTLVFPSLWHEPAGLVTLEAYANCRPVIASRLGGIPEYVSHQNTGILVSANDIKALSSAITELAENYLRAKQLGEQGYVHLLKNFMLEQHIQQLQEVYEKTIHKFNSSKHFPLVIE